MCLQAAIRKELNEFKSSEMEVHEESRIYTRSAQTIQPHSHLSRFPPSGNKNLCILLLPPGSTGHSCAADQESDWKTPPPVPDRPASTPQTETGTKTAEASRPSGLFQVLDCGIQDRERTPPAEGRRTGKDLPLGWYHSLALFC